MLGVDWAKKSVSWLLLVPGGWVPLLVPGETVGKVFHPEFQTLFKVSCLYLKADKTDSIQEVGGGEFLR